MATTPAGPNPTTMTKDQLIAALRAGADGADMRAAVEMLVGYNDGDLLDCVEVRRHISPEGADGARVYWTRLYATATSEDAGDIDGLGTTGRGALLLACALKAKVPIDSLAGTLRQFGQHNALVAMHAFGTALGINGTAQLAADNTRQAREIDRLDAELTRRDDVINGLRDSMATNGTMPPVYLVREALDRAQGITSDPAANLGPTRRLRPELRPAATSATDGTLNAGQLASEIGSLLRAADADGMTAGQITAGLSRRGITTTQIVVVSTLNIMIAHDGSVSQPDTDGPYYWRADADTRR